MYSTPSGGVRNHLNRGMVSSTGNWLLGSELKVLRNLRKLGWRASYSSDIFLHNSMELKLRQTNPPRSRNYVMQGPWQVIWYRCELNRTWMAGSTVVCVKKIPSSLRGFAAWHLSLWWWFFVNSLPSHSSLISRLQLPHHALFRPRR